MKKIYGRPPARQLPALAVILTTDVRLAIVEAHLYRTGICPTRLGVIATGDRQIVSRLRDGRGCSTSRAVKLVFHIAAGGGR